MQDTIDIALILLLIVVFGFAIYILGEIALSDRIGFAARKAKIDQLRIDIQKLGAKTPPEIVQGVVATNQLIVANKQHAGNWWTRPFYSANWKQIDTIDIPDPK